MSNTKEVWIEGQMPFNVYENADAKGWLGLMNSPSVGIRISYADYHWKALPNGGKLAMYEFTIKGREAMRYDAFFKMCKDFKAVGAEITKLMLMDLDDNGPWEDYISHI